MQLFCDTNTFKEALRICEGLLSEEELIQRGVSQASEGINTTRLFLNHILERVQAGLSSYEELIEVLQDSQVPREYSNLSGLTGKFLDAVQIVKPSTIRNKRVRGSIVEALRRTGHDFLWREWGETRGYEEELLRSTATFQLLEIASFIDLDQSRNPINTLRNSMGARLPEEYFAELLAGWIMEDVLKGLLQSKGFDCILEGPDKTRKIQFVRPSEMGVYDFRASKGSETFYLELQRIGKLSRGGDTDRIKTYLKRHKYEGGNRADRILVLWVGRPKQKTYGKWEQKIVLISNFVDRGDIDFRNQNVHLPEEKFDEALPWGVFKEASGEEIAELFRRS